MGKAAETAVSFFVWYNRLDKTNIRLLGRIIAKGISTGDLNKFMREQLYKILDEPMPKGEIEASAEAEEEKR